jgi:hypothetical protein
MKESAEITDDELRLIMYALTLDERPHSRERWLKKGFKKIHQRGASALFDYWKRRIETSQDALDYALEKKTLYKQAIADLKNNEQIVKIDPPPATPSATKMAANLWRAAVDEAKAVVTQQPAITVQDQAKRMKLCEACDRYLTEQSRCSACGCYMKVKTKLRSAYCPLGKW